MRLMEGGADIHQIAKNCRTRVAMIEEYCALHLKTNPHSATIIVRTPRKARHRENTSCPSDGDH